MGPLTMSKPKSKIRKESHQINKDLSLLENNSKMAELYLIITSKKNPPYISSLDLEEECKSSSKPSPEKPSLSMLNLPIPLTMSKPKSKTKKVFLQINKDLSSPENNLKTVVLYLITTSKKNPPYISY